MNYGDVIQKARRRLMSGIREQIVQLTQPYVAGGSTLYVAGGFTGAIETGARLSIDLEVFYVQSVTSAGAIGVIGGYEGSTPADHVAGAQVTINPRFSDFDIGVAVNDDLLDLSSPTNGMGKISAIDITFNPAFQGYDLGAGFDSVSSKILEVSFKIAPPVRTYPLIRKGEYRVIRNQSDTSVFPSGNGVILYRPAYPGLPIRVQYLAPFSPLVNLTDDLHTVSGLPTTAYDLPDLGAAIRLVEPREVKRNFVESQPDPRKATEVPPGAIGASIKDLMLRRQERIDAEADRIMRAYPNAEV